MQNSRQIADYFTLCAGRENRTLVSCLASRCHTTKLYPQTRTVVEKLVFLQSPSAADISMKEDIPAFVSNYSLYMIEGKLKPTVENSVDMCIKDILYKSPIGNKKTLYRAF